MYFFQDPNLKAILNLQKDYFSCIQKAVEKDSAVGSKFPIKLRQRALNEFQMLKESISLIEVIQSKLRFPFTIVQFSLFIALIRTLADKTLNFQHESSTKILRSSTFLLCLNLLWIPIFRFFISDQSGLHGLERILGRYYHLSYDLMFQGIFFVLTLVGLCIVCISESQNRAEFGSSLSHLSFATSVGFVYMFIFVYLFRKIQSKENLYLKPNMEELSQWENYC